MKTKITRDEYDLLTFLKSSQDQLEKLSERFYFYAEKILKQKDNSGYLVDYFNNDISITEFLNNIDVGIEESKNEEN